MAASKPPPAHAAPLAARAAAAAQCAPAIPASNSESDEEVKQPLMLPAPVAAAQPSSPPSLPVNPHNVIDNLRSAYVMEYNSGSLPPWLMISAAPASPGTATGYAQPSRASNPEPSPNPTLLEYVNETLRQPPPPPPPPPSSCRWD